MAFEISFKPIALIDVDEAIAWYEAEVKGLGGKFLNSLSGTLEKIKLNPLQYPVILNPVRRALVKNFPYLVLFSAEEK